MRTWRGDKVSLLKLIEPVTLLGFLVSISLAFSSFVYGVEAAPRPDYGGAVLRVLVEEGICTSLVECMREDYVFGEYEQFIYLNVYGVRDERVISRIASSVSKELKKGTNEKVVVSFFFFLIKITPA